MAADPRARVDCAGFTTPDTFNLLTVDEGIPFLKRLFQRCLDADEDTFPFRYATKHWRSVTCVATPNNAASARTSMLCVKEPTSGGSSAPL